MGLPMLNGFVGEFLILLGTYLVHWNWAAWAATGVILSACYLLWSYQRVFFGEVTHQKNSALPDTDARENWILATVVIVILWMGIGSPFFTRRFAVACKTAVEQANHSFAQEAALPGFIPKTAKSDNSRPILVSTAAATSSERSGTR